MWFSQPNVMTIPTFCNDLIVIVLRNDEPVCVVFVLRTVINYIPANTVFIWKKVFMYKVQSGTFIKRSNIAKQYINNYMNDDLISQMLDPQKTPNTSP